MKFLKHRKIPRARIKHIFRVFAMISTHSWKDIRFPMLGGPSCSCCKCPIPNTRQSASEETVHSSKLIRML